jgi:hypothetical protein
MMDRNNVRSKRDSEGLVDPGLAISGPGGSANLGDTGPPLPGRLFTAVDESGEDLA